MCTLKHDIYCFRPVREKHICGQENTEASCFNGQTCLYNYINWHQWETVQFQVQHTTQVSVVYLFILSKWMLQVYAFIMILHYILLFQIGWDLRWTYDLRAPEGPLEVVSCTGKKERASQICSFDRWSIHDISKGHGSGKLICYERIIRVWSKLSWLYISYIWFFSHFRSILYANFCAALVKPWEGYTSPFFVIFVNYPLSRVCGRTSLVKGLLRASNGCT